MAWSIPSLVASAAQIQAATTNAIIGCLQMIGGAMTTWSPTVTGITVGNGTLSARYKQVDKMVDFKIVFTFGSTSTIAAGTTFTLPATAQDANGSYFGSMTDVSAPATWPMGVVNTSTTVIAIRTFPTTAGNAYASVTATVPFTWATGDVLFIQGRYEAA